MNEPTIGSRARDVITGFEGVVTGRCEYITGCTQLLLQPPAKDGAYVDSHWFDIDRCQPISGAVVDLPVTVPGPDKPAPKR